MEKTNGQVCDVVEREGVNPWYQTIAIFNVKFWAVTGRYRLNVGFNLEYKCTSWDAHLFSVIKAGHCNYFGIFG